MRATLREIDRRLSRIEHTTNKETGVLIVGPDEPIPPGREHWHIIIDDVPRE